MKRLSFLFLFFVVVLLAQNNNLKVKYFYDDASFYFYYKDIMECSRFMIKKYNKEKDSIYLRSTLKYLLNEDTSEVLLPECIISLGEILFELKNLNKDLYNNTIFYVVFNAPLMDYCKSFRCFKTGKLDIE